MAASTYFAQVQQLYIAYFGRPADTVGLAYWAAQIDAANGSIASVQAGFSASTESQALFGNKSTIDKVTAIYQNAFNRAPEPAGLAYWVAQLDSGKVTQAQASWTIQQSAGAGDAAAVQNKLTAAQAFTAQIDTTAEIQGYQGTGAADAGRAFLSTVNSNNATATAAVAAAPTALSAAVAAGGSTGTSFVLTTGIDNLVGTSNNDTFTAVADGTTATLNTVSAGDSIDGGNGVDTLKLIVANTAGTNTQLAGVNVKNVENISVQNVAVGATTVNLQPIAGVTTVTALNSAGDVTFQNLAAGTELVVSGSAQVGDVNFNQLNAADAVKVTLTGGVNGVNVTANTGSATSASVNSTGAANGAVTADVLALTNNAGTLTALAVNADTSLRASLTATDYAATGAALTVTGAGAVNLGNAGVFKTINAATATGGLTVGLSSVTSSYVGGSGSDTVTGTAVAAGASIDGGAGIDTVAATLINVGNSAAFKNFELIDVTGSTATGTLDAALLTGSTISGVTIAGTVGNAFALSNLVETTAGFNVNVTGTNANAVTLGFTAASVAGTADVLNYNFNAAAAAIATTINGGNITSTGIESINISSKGGLNISNALTVTDNTAKSIVITGDHALSLTVTAQSGTGASQLTSIDGSAATAGLTIATSAATTTTGQSALTIKGGSAVDTISVATSATAGSVAPTITTGAGNDTVNVANASIKSITAVQFATVTDFAKGDVLTFGAANTSGFTTAKVNVSAATSFAAALDAVQTAQGTTKAVSWFTYGSDTYVVDNVDGAATLGTTDIVVKLTGTLDLSTSTLVTGTGALTFA